MIVTGAGAGFGRVTALALADAGYTVYGAFRGSRLGFDEVSASVKAEAAANGSTLQTVQIDVTDDASVDAGVSSILARAGRIDGLVNVARFGVHGPWETFTVQQFKDQLETNLVGVFRMCLAVAPTMRAQRSGTIVNFSSDAGIRAGFWEVAYSASKYGLEGMSLGMRVESQQFGIRVCVVEAGIGKAMLLANAILWTDLVFVGIFLTSALALALFAFDRLVGRRLSTWEAATRGR